MGMRWLCTKHLNCGKLGTHNYVTYGTLVEILLKEHLQTKCARLVSDLLKIIFGVYMFCTDTQFVPIAVT